jgi:hypothetical protein
MIPVLYSAPTLDYPNSVFEIRSLSSLTMRPILASSVLSTATLPVRDRTITPVPGAASPETETDASAKRVFIEPLRGAGGEQELDLPFPELARPLDGEPLQEIRVARLRGEPGDPPPHAPHDLLDQALAAPELDFPRLELDLREDALRLEGGRGLALPERPGRLSGRLPFRLSDPRRDLLAGEAERFRGLCRRVRGDCAAKIGDSRIFHPACPYLYRAFNF